MTNPAEGTKNVPKLELLIFVRIETAKVYMNDGGIIDMTKKLPHGHNIGGGNKQKRRQEYKKEKNSE